MSRPEGWRDSSMGQTATLGESDPLPGKEETPGANQEPFLRGGACEDRP